MSNKKSGIYLAVPILVIIIGFYVYSTRQHHKNLYTSGQKEDASVSRSGRSRFGSSSKLADIPMSRFDHADTLRKAQSDELVAEVRKVLDQNGMFADVFAEEKDKNKRARNEETNIAVTLHELFSDYYTLKEIPPNTDEEDLQMLLKQHWESSDLYKLWEASPDASNGWDINKQTLAKINTALGSAALAHLESIRQTLRRKLKASGTHFSYIFVYSDSYKSSRSVGTVMNTEASKYLGDYALLEEYAIARSLQEGKIDEAIETLDYIFRIAYLASILEVVGVRSDAAIVRLQAFEIMQRVILDPKFEKKHLIGLRDMLSQQYDNWTPEYLTWFGDRASGIAFYHRIMADGMENIFPQEDIARLENRWGSQWNDKFWRGFKKYGEADEVFYLRSMQKILDICDKPFAQRRNVLTQISADLRRSEDVHDADGMLEEYVVANILLKDVDRLMRLFVQDESALHRALTAMLISLGQTNTDKYCDPFTGKPFAVQKADGFVSIAAEPFPRPFRVPNFTNKE